MKTPTLRYMLLLCTIFATSSTLENRNEHNSTDSLKLFISKVDSCIAKIRTIAGINANFRNKIDRLAQIAQYDAIDELLRNKVNLNAFDQISKISELNCRLYNFLYIILHLIHSKYFFFFQNINILYNDFLFWMFLMCTDEEITAMTEFLNEEIASIEIIQLVALNMTKNEQNFVNQMENINNLASLRDFYLNKYNSLPHDQYEMLRRSYNKIWNKFVNSNLKENIAHFLNALTPNENNQLRAYGILSEEDKLVAFINEKIAATNFTSIDKSEIKHYLKGLFMSLKLEQHTVIE
ncbi:unnamed protein product [Wuchereria bancrofti]|uniref:Uncharacterized protein n=2 Tax=Wuchereria bancrofti TaxID=6293 RepID=A0A3P7FRF1_WUCBA|nr:unnamed protein product [Wuchereria bancrofti]